VALLKKNLDKVFLILTPASLIALAIFAMPPSWAASVLIFLLYFVFIGIKGRVLVAHAALGLAAISWTLLLPEVAFSFLAALVIMVLFSCVPESKRVFKINTTMSEDIQNPNLNPYSTHGRNIGGSL